ncbi:MAG: GDSL-type esterase/lipase family protein [Acidobacteriota bacterium]
MRVMKLSCLSVCVALSSISQVHSQALSQPERVALARAHAELFGDPDSYLSPAVFDAWTDVFHGRSPYGMTQAESASVPVTGCPGGLCPPSASQLCIASLDPDADGTDEFRPGDVIGLTYDYRPRASHVITSIDAHPLAAACAGGGALLTVQPPIDTTVEPVSGVVVRDLWSNAFHASAAGYFLLGYSLANGSRLRDGATGPPMTSIDHGASGEDAPSLVARGTRCSSVSWSPAASELAPRCVEGTAGEACHVARSARRKSQLISTQSAAIQSGHRYLVSGFVCNDTITAVRLELVARKNSHWKRLPFSSVRVPPPSVGTADCRSPEWIEREFLAPQSLDRVRLQVSWERAPGDTAGPTVFIDSLTLRRLADSPTTVSSPFLLNDPGDRRIVVTGDSWTTGTYIEQGIEASLSNRLGRDLSAQVISTGRGGYTTDSVIANFDAMIGQHEPLYAVISVGVNEAYLRRGPDAFVASVRALAARCRAEGIIPIFIGVPPVGLDEGTGSMLEYAYLLRDAQRAALLDIAPNH